MKLRLLGLVYLLIAACIWAAPQRDPAAEKKIEAALAHVDPTLVEPFRQARIAFDAGDYAKSTELLRRVVAKAPEFDPALRRLGASLVMAGDFLQGRQWAEQAVALNRSSENLSSLAYLLAIRKGATPADLRQASVLLREARVLTSPPDPYAVTLAVQVALQLNELEDARTLTAELDRIAPDQMATHYFDAVVATMDGHWVKADREIRRAGTLGLDAATVTRFRESGVHSRAVAWLVIGTIAWLIVAWIIGLVAFARSGLCFRAPRCGRSNALPPMARSRRVSTGCAVSIGPCSRSRACITTSRCP